MESIPDEPRAAMLIRIQQSLDKAQARADRLKQIHARLIWAGLSTSALATALAGLTAAAGPLAGEGPPAWRLTCGAVAVLTALSGLVTGLHQRMNISDQRANAIACVGRLRGLELALTIRGRDVHEVAGDYEQVVAGFQEYVY